MRILLHREAYLTILFVSAGHGVITPIAVEFDMSTTQLEQRLALHLLVGSIMRYLRALGVTHLCSVGTDIAIFGMLWGDGGRADVFIDNELVGAAGINCYGADETCNSQLFYKSGLDGYSTHTIVVKTLDTRWIYLQQIR